MITVNGPKIRELAGQVNVGTEIWDVRVVQLHAHASESPVLGNLSVEVELETTADQHGDALETRSRYRARALAAAPDEEGKDEESVAWDVSFEVAALFRIHQFGETAPSFNDAQLAAFAASTGAMALHPYARELLQNTTNRLGYPPYTLELLRSGWDLGDDEEIELAVDDGVGQ